MCEICHGTGWQLEDNTAHYCSCEKGRQMKAAHREAHHEPTDTPTKKEWQQYKDEADDVPF